MSLAGNLQTVATWGLSIIAVVCLFVLGAQVRGRPRRLWRPRDPTRHLRYVLDADFAATPVMRHMEYQAFKVVEREVLSLRRGLRVFSQTALGAVLKTPDEQAFWAVNSKRVDVLVVGPNGMPLLVVEYQGSGHHQNDAAARDAVKREALRKAGVEYLEVFEHTNDDEIRRMVREAINRRAPAPRRPASATSAGAQQAMSGSWVTR
jgi:hypothetical protein